MMRMTRFWMICGVVAAVSMAGCKKKEAAPETPTPPAAPSTSMMPAGNEATVVNAMDEQVECEVGCAGCVYHMDGVMSCTPAMKVNGKTFLISIKDFDAHSAGICEGACKAHVTGHFSGDKFEAAKIVLDDAAAKSEPMQMD